MHPRIGSFFANDRRNRSWRVCRAISVGLIVMLAHHSDVSAQTQRAAPPQFDQRVVSRVFFPDLSSAFRGDRPTLSKLRNSGADMASAAEQSSGDSDDSTGGWAKLISAISIEDEIKRVKLKYDATLTSPGAFNGGGYQDARLHLTVLASLFAIISEYSGDVRWKDQAATARDLTAKTALACAAGSTPVFKEAQLRKADLQDLVSGSGLTAAKTSDAANDWSMIADRVPLMQYAEKLLDEISGKSRSAASTEENVDAVKRLAELMAVLGEILVQDGMHDAEDEDYRNLSHAMTKASRSVVGALERKDFDSVGKAVGNITQSCTDCHEMYR